MKIKPGSHPIEQHSDMTAEELIYQINSFGADFLVDGIVNRMDRGDIYIPDFQRNFVWSLSQASRFIESILLGLPIPGIFLYREPDSHKHLIIDGLQRLTTIHSFKKGRFPGSDKPFQLIKVADRFRGRSIEDLDPSDYRRFEDAAIHATIIQQTAPQNDASSAIHIFERINTGGTPLQAQEIRSAIFHGPFQSLLESLNAEEKWRKVYGKESSRGKDQEYILRFFALYYSWHYYRSPMKKFLNDFMREHRFLDSISEHEFQQLFLDTLEFVIDAFGEKPFRPRGTLNVAVLDSVMVAIAWQRTPIGSPQKRYKRLLEDAEYSKAVNQATADEISVKERIKLAIEYFS